MLGKKIRHIGRYHEVARVFAKHGLGFIVQDLGLLIILSLPERLFTQEIALIQNRLGSELGGLWHKNMVFLHLDLSCNRMGDITSLNYFFGGILIT